jgi:hypothetical protein
MVQPAVPPPPQPAKRSRRWLLWLGIGLLLAGIIGSIVTFVLQHNQYEDSVDELARAVPGFSTRLDFESSGTYSLYYENEGEFTAELDGEPTQVKLDAPSDPVDFSATLTDGDGNDVRIHSSSDDVDYDVGGHRGTLVSTVDIDQPGDYRLQVASDDPADDGPNSYAVALGKGHVSEPSTLWPAIILGLGIILGALAIVLGATRRRDTSPAPAGAGAVAMAPPGGASYGGYGYDPTAPPPATFAPPVSPPSAPTADGFDAPVTQPAPWSQGFDPPTHPTSTAPTPGFDPPTQPVPSSAFAPPTQPALPTLSPEPAGSSEDPVSEPTEQVRSPWSSPSVDPQADDDVSSSSSTSPWGAPRPPSER